MYRLQGVGIVVPIAWLIDRPIAKLALFEKVLQKHKWLAGDNVTFVDFCFYEYFDVVSKH